MRTVLIAVLCLAAAACSRSQNARIEADTKAAGNDVSEATSSAMQDVKNNPEVKKLQSDTRQAAHDAANAARAAAANVEVKTGQAMVEAGQKAKDAAAETGGNRSDKSRD